MKTPILPALLTALCLIAPACDSKKTPASPANDKPAPLADPTGKWEIRDDGLVQADGTWPKKEHYIFTRYEFKGDGSFVREMGASGVPADTQRVNGSWKVVAFEPAPLVPRLSSLVGDPPAQKEGSGIFRKSDPIDELRKTAGLPEVKDGPAPARGTLVLSYSVKKKDDIPVGATLVAEQGRSLEPPDSFSLQERHPLYLREAATSGSGSLAVGNQTFRKTKP